MKWDDSRYNPVVSFKRLPYRPWTALAELVDNSVSSFRLHRKELDAAMKATGDSPYVTIVYNNKDDILRVSDNAFGMDLEDIQNALTLGKAPTDQSQLSQYGLGLKTATIWFANETTIQTSRLGEPVRRTVTYRFSDLVEGKTALQFTEEEADPDLHFTIIEMSKLDHHPKTRTVSMIGTTLQSMYRRDLARGLKISVNDRPLAFPPYTEDVWLKDADGKPYKKDFVIEIDGIKAKGWVGIFKKDAGGRSKAGFALMWRDRAIKAEPDAWKPQNIYGEVGSNDTVNQRLVGEIDISEFNVSHTKDEIVFMGDQEDAFQDALLEECRYMRETALIPYKNLDGSESQRPKERDAVRTQRVIEEVESAEVVTVVEETPLPSPSFLQKVREDVLNSQGDTHEFVATVGHHVVGVRLKYGLSPAHPYVVLNSASENEAIVVVNMNHPYASSLDENEFEIYLRECVYDGLVQHLAMNSNQEFTPDLLTWRKNELFRATMEYRGREG
jgi:hypothetical protein